MSIYGPVISEELFDDVATVTRDVQKSCVICSKLYLDDDRTAQLCDACIASGRNEMYLYIENVLKSSLSRIRSREGLLYSLTMNDDTKDHIIADENVQLAKKYHRILINWSHKATEEIEKL